MTRFFIDFFGRFGRIRSDVRFGRSFVEFVDRSLPNLADIMFELARKRFSLHSQSSRSQMREILCAQNMVFKAENMKKVKNNSKVFEKYAQSSK